MKFVFSNIMSSVPGATLIKELYNSMVALKEGTRYNHFAEHCEIRAPKITDTDEKFLVSGDSKLRLLLENKVVMPILFKGKTRCLYFISVGPINPYLQYQSLDIYISNSEDKVKVLRGEIPEVISEIRDVILNNFCCFFIYIIKIFQNFSLYIRRSGKTISDLV